MRLLLLKEGLAVTVGPFTFIPNHITKASVALGLSLGFMAYSAKEFGWHHYENALGGLPLRLDEGDVS
jgi:hypothetical protein